MNFEFYDEREKHTKDTRLKIFRSSAPCFRKFLEGKHQGTPNLKILRSRHQETQEHFEDSQEHKNMKEEHQT